MKITLFYQRRKDVPALNQKESGSGLKGLKNIKMKN